MGGSVEWLSSVIVVVEVVQRQKKIYLLSIVTSCINCIRSTFAFFSFRNRIFFILTNPVHRNEKKCNSEKSGGQRFLQSSVHDYFFSFLVKV
jgi:hypothetical protein